MAKKTVVNHVDMLKEMIDILGITPVTRDYVYQKDFSILQDFTDEELAEELCRRTSLGKELE